MCACHHHPPPHPPEGEYTGGDIPVYHRQICSPGRQDCGVRQASPPPQTERAYENMGGEYPGVDSRCDAGVGPITRTLVVGSEPSPDCVQE